METMGSKLRKNARGLVDKVNTGLANPNSRISKTLTKVGNIAEDVANCAQNVAEKVKRGVQRADNRHYLNIKGRKQISYKNV